MTCLATTVQTIKDNINELTPREKKRFEAICSDIEGSYADDEQLEFLEELADRFA